MPTEDNALLPPQESSLFEKKWILWSLIGVLMVGVIGFLFFAFTFPFRDQVFSLLYQRFPGLAWKTAQSAQAVCSDLGTVDLQVSFTNTEPVNLVWCMNVVATDLRTGESIDLGSVEAGETATGVIETNISPLGAGQVRFELTWCDGRKGIDSRTVSYDATTCQLPSPTPKPTLTPSPSPTEGPSPTPTPTPTPPVTTTPGSSPTITPSATVTSSPSPTTTVTITQSSTPTTVPTFTPNPTERPIGVVVDPTATPTPNPSPTPLEVALPNSGTVETSLTFFIFVLLSLGTGEYLLRTQRLS